MMTPTSVTGVVLCGGSGRRMGGADKPLVALGGRPLLAHVIERVLPQVDDLMLSVNRNMARYQDFRLPIVSDEAPDLGPLAGVVAAAGRLPQPATSWLFVAPGDSPLIPRDLVARLRAGLAQGDEVAVPNDGTRLQPLFMLVSARAAATINDYHAAGGRSVQGWLRERAVREVTVPSAHGFANVNTPADLERLARIGDRN